MQLFTKLKRYVSEGEGKQLDIKELYKLYIHDVYRYLLSLCKDESVAEDLTQDTFMKAYAALDQHTPTNTKSWLIKIAYHTFIDYIRRHKKMDYKEPTFFHDLSSNETAEGTFVRKLDEENLLNNLNKLPDIQRKAIILFDLQGFSYRKIAKMLGLKENTLKSHIFRGRSRLRQMYKKGRATDE